MNFKMSLCASAMALILAGCNSGSSSDVGGDGGGEGSDRVITVIDGYLANAEVCVDRNENAVCDEGEFLGTTNSQGKFTVSKANANYPVLVRVVAGSSIDQDRIGYVTETYTMAAEADSAVVTPFTTVAMASNQTVEALAAELGLEADLVSGDYVAAKGDEESAEAAAAVHALARSLVAELPENANDLDGDALVKTAGDIKDAIDDHVNNVGSENLDNIDFVRSESGDFEVVDVINDLKTYLVGGNESAEDPQTVWSIANFSTFWAKREGVFDVWLTEDALYALEEGVPASMTYSVTGNVLSKGEGEEIEHDEFIYTSSSIAFAVPEQGDLTLWTTEDLLGANTVFDNSYFAEQTWFMVLDDGQTEESVPTFAEFRFGTFDVDNNTGDVTLVEDGENYQTTWSIADGSLRVEFDEEEGDTPLIVSFAATNGSLTIVRNHEHTEDVFSFMTQNGELAANILNKWVSAK
ncbi:hypothetical protein [Thaumasiovibrio subtropicus]|uniref:hypothetical protein n=1 Tax=Thaumasiovibrio subtropicus TaxID=1891207 RepID=UPI00131C1D45|nr:hypothetical protein [Thaumasiovibrio subtropicus]